MIARMFQCIYEHVHRIKQFEINYCIQLSGIFVLMSMNKLHTFLTVSLYGKFKTVLKQ